MIAPIPRSQLASFAVPAIISAQIHRFGSSVPLYRFIASCVLLLSRHRSHSPLPSAEGSSSLPSGRRFSLLADIRSDRIDQQRKKHIGAFSIATCRHARESGNSRHARARGRAAAGASAPPARDRLPRDRPFRSRMHSSSGPNTARGRSTRGWLAIDPLPPARSLEKLTYFRKSRHRNRQAHHPEIIREHS